MKLVIMLAFVAVTSLGLANLPNNEVAALAGHEKGNGRSPPTVVNGPAL